MILGIYRDMGKWGGWRRRSRRGGSGFWRLPPFALPFRLLAGFKGNGFRRVSLFALPFALLRGEKATNFSAFPHLRCLSAHAPQNEFFRQTHCNPAPGMVQYRVSSYVFRHACMAGEHRLRHSCKALEWRFNCE